MKVPDLYVGKRLFVGDGLPVCLGIGPAEIRGSAYVEGPMVVGAPIFGGPEANVMISRCLNLDAGGAVPSLVKIRGLIAPTPIDVVVGDPAGPVGINCFCGPSSFVVTAATIDLINILYTNFSELREEFSALAQDISPKVFAGAKLELGVDHNLALAFNSAPVIGKSFESFVDYVTPATTLNTTHAIALSKKSFDIPHPKKKNTRVRHVCVEGPSADVYYRGKMKDTNIINLPEYWDGLVDPDTITVSLTSIGSFQALYYKEVEWGKTFRVFNSDGGPINCSYVIYAERLDVEKNIPVYEGLTINDYPGDNSEYRINDN